GEHPFAAFERIRRVATDVRLRIRRMPGQRSGRYPNSKITHGEPAPAPSRHRNGVCRQPLSKVPDTDTPSKRPPSRPERPGRARFDRGGLARAPGLRAAELGEGAGRGGGGSVRVRAERILASRGTNRWK